VVDTSTEAMILIEYLAERGIIANYDLVGMPNEIDELFQDISEVDGKKFVIWIEKRIRKFEQEIIEYLLNNPSLKEILKYGEDLFSQINHDTLSFKRSNRGVNKGKITIKAMHALLSISEYSYIYWLKGTVSPSTKIFNDIYKCLEDNFKMGKEVFGKDFFSFINDEKTNIIIKHIKSVLTEGDKITGWQSDYMKYFGRYPNQIPNIKKEILKLLIDNKGVEIDQLLGTESEGKNGEGLFESLLNKYKTFNDKKKLTEYIYYLSFGLAQTNYKTIEKAVEMGGLLKLITTQFEFIDKLINKGILDPKKGIHIQKEISLEVSCIKKGHKRDKLVVDLLSGRHGCQDCTVWTNEKITQTMVYDIFKKMETISPNIQFLEFKMQKSYTEIFSKETIQSFEGYDKDWNPNYWRVDAYVKLKISDKIVEIVIESDGLQHSKTDEGFKAWLYLTHNYKILDKIADEKLKTIKRSELESYWHKMRIIADDFRDKMFEDLDAKYSLRVPTWSPDLKYVWRRTEYILARLIPFLEENYNLNLTQDISEFDEYWFMDEKMWEKISDDVNNFNKLKN